MLAAGSCGVSGAPTGAGGGLARSPWGRNSVRPENQLWGDQVNEASDRLHAGGWSGAAVTVHVPGAS